MNKEILVFFNARRCFALSTITLASLSLTGCFTEEIDSRQTQEIRGLIYKVHADDPFTGRILNYPMSVLGLFSVGTCSIDVKKGLPDGEMRCSDNADKLLAVGEFKAGKRDGKEEKFDAKTGNKIAEGNWKRGLQDGLLEQFNPQNGERTIEVHYTAGKKDGQERAWDEQGKVLIADLDWKNGKQTGFDNRGTQHRTYLQGEYHGPQKDYGIDGNRFYVSQEENYENGQLHGTQKRINARGNVTELSEFEHGKLKARTVDEYGNFDGKHLHHVSRLAIKEDVNQYIASDLSNDGLEQYWDNEGHLIRELQWNKGRLVSATATIWVGDKQISQYQGVARPGYDSHQDDVVKHGQERLYDRNGELDAVVVWSAGKVTNTIVNLPSDRRSQYPGKMAMLNPNMSWGNPVEEIPDFETPSRYGGGGFAIDYVTIVDTPAPGQPIQSQPVQKTVLAASTSNNVDACVQQKVDAVHAEDPDALVRADMLDEFEQDCQ